MGTTTADMTSWSKASQQMADLLVGTKAVVAWIGYETPPVPDLINQDLTVLENHRARQGGAALATALRGLSAVRRDNPVVPDVIGHSFGSTTAAFALLEDGVQVDAFVILGSAGLPPEAAHASDLHANAVYPGQAHGIAPWDDGGGDKWAQSGRGPLSQHQVDPMDPAFGGHPFGVETGGDAGRIVTDHEALISDHGPRAGYFDKNTEASLNAARAIQGDLDGITPYSRPEPLPPAEVPQ